MTAPQKKHLLTGARIVVTGGFGFIGAHLVKALLKHEPESIQIVDSLETGDPTRIQKHPKIQHVQLRLGEVPKATLASTLGKFDYLFHIAARKYNGKKESVGLLHDCNIKGTLELFEVAAEAGVKKIVFSSSLYAHGRYSGAKLSELDLPEPKTYYGITKLYGESVLRYFAKAYSMDTVALRYFFVYGPYQFSGAEYKSVISHNFQKLMRNERPTIHGDGTQVLDYVYIDDVVKATTLAMQIDVSGDVLHVGSGRGASVNELIGIMQTTAGTKLEPQFVDKDWTHGTSRISETSVIATKLGWRAETSLEAGLKHTFEHLRRGQK